VAQVHFVETEDHHISLEDAAVMTRRYRTSNPDALRGGSIGKTAVMDLLRQADCTGLKFYFARKEDGSADAVFVGVDKAGNDMTGGIILERSYPCPPYCGEQNPLNSGSQ
jgi:hypothetical protein